MFVGHYSVAFAARSEKDKIPLWILFIAVQFLDYMWATLVLLGIEKLRVIKGFTAGSMLDSYFHPYSHSLIAAIIWRRDNFRMQSAPPVALAVPRKIGWP